MNEIFNFLLLFKELPNWIWTGVFFVVVIYNKKLKKYILPLLYAIVKKKYNLDIEEDKLISDIVDIYDLRELCFNTNICIIGTETIIANDKETNEKLIPLIESCRKKKRKLVISFAYTVDINKSFLSDINKVIENILDKNSIMIEIILPKDPKTDNMIKLCQIMTETSTKSSIFKVKTDTYPSLLHSHLTTTTH